MTVHKKAQLLRCHHCDYQEKLPSHCPACGSTRLDYVGIGTQRSEQFLAEQFSEFPVLRIDRDSMSRKHALDDMLARIHTGKPCLLIGTQMLAKGHHFPHVTLVVILDIDNGLFSADFRGPEKMGQLLEQVAGRAGRAEKPGRVLIQSRFSEHPLLQTLLKEGYQRLARVLLAERQVSALPPYYYMALLRAEHTDPYRAQQILRDWREQLKGMCENGVQIAGPFPASMEKRAGLYRLELHIKSESRMALQKTLSTFCIFADKQKIPADLRWSLDVDPAG
jgi:primosomal protein N' (replication factor Y)